MNNQLTIVTALYDIGRGDLDGFGRTFDHYTQCFRKLLAVDLPMVIFIPEELNEFVRTARGDKLTHIVNREVSTLENFPFYNEVQSIRTNPKWAAQSGWMPDSPQAQLPLYNPLVMSKQFFMNDAAIFNVFNTKYFLWVDAGISNTIGNPVENINDSFSRKLMKLFSDNKMHYVCFPYEPAAEIHGFEKEEFYRRAGERTKYVARGGIFGGSKDAIHRVNDLYYSTLSGTLQAGYMGTEESVFTLITYNHPHACTTHMIESNGLVIKFLNDVNAIDEEPYDKLLAIYVLTFNLPAQFRLWAETFEKNLDEGLRGEVVKYVINNSTDPTVDDEYQKIFEEFGFEETKFDNIGICGGRQFAAEHFHENNHKYMLFFEDDMLLCGIDNNNKPCKNGFRKYFRNMLTNAIDIVESEDLDYLKLCFSEFYGDNHDNWAWYNVDQTKKDKWFLTNELVSDPKKVRIFYTNSYAGIPYAVGEYHYCNWPLLFNRRGNKAIFLDTKFEHKYEQVWMSFVMEKITNKEIRAGCLLGSPITHHRKYHYDKKIRRENEHYTN